MQREKKNMRFEEVEKNTVASSNVVQPSYQGDYGLQGVEDYLPTGDRVLYTWLHWSRDEKTKH